MGGFESPCDGAMRTNDIHESDSKQAVVRAWSHLLVWSLHPSPFPKPDVALMSPLKAAPPVLVGMSLVVESGSLTAFQSNLVTWTPVAKPACCWLALESSWNNLVARRAISSLCSEQYANLQGKIGEYGG